MLLRPRGLALGSSTSTQSFAGSAALMKRSRNILRYTQSSTICQIHCSPWMGVMCMPLPPLPPSFPPSLPPTHPPTFFPSPTFFPHRLPRSSSLPHLAPTFFVDLSAPSLHLYGAGSLEALESPPHGPQPVTEIHFHCIEFEEIAPWLPKLAHSYPNSTVGE